jgi:hypothetical protein
MMIDSSSEAVDNNNGKNICSRNEKYNIQEKNNMKFTVGRSTAVVRRLTTLSLSLSLSLTVGRSTAVVRRLTTSMECSDMGMETSICKYSDMCAVKKKRKKIVEKKMRQRHWHRQ